MKKLLVALVLGIFISVPVFSYAQTVLFPNRGGTGTTTIPTVGQVLVGLSNGTYAPVATSSLGITGGGGSSKWTDSGSVIYPTTGESIEVSSIAATGTATSTFTKLAVSTALNLFGTIGSALSDFCVAITGGSGLCDGNDATGGGGSGSNWDIVSGGLETATTTDFARASYFVATSTTATSSFAGNITVNGTTRIATSITGLIKATSGVLSAATAGTDYVATTSGNWTGTFDGLEGTSFLDRANHTGTQLAATISDFVSNARTSISETITGLTYNSGTGVLSLDGGYVIPLTASTTEWSTAYASTTNLTPTYIRNLFSNTATGLTYTAGTGLTALTAGYNIPLTASTTEWSGFYNTPSTRITAGTNLSWSGNTLNATAGGGSSHATSSWTVCSLSTCDYVTDGTADEVQINQALSAASSTGGVIQIFAGEYAIASPILLSGLATEGDGNPEITLVGMGREATNLNGASNVNVIEIRNRAKYDISKMSINISGSGTGIKGIAGTERGNWQSNIEDIYIIGDFATMASTSWGIDLQSPFRMRLANIEMNGVANGANLSSHTDSFNPGNLSIDRMFIDLWDNAANASSTGLKIGVASSSSTGVNNLVSVNRLDIAGGTNLTNSIGVHILGSISSYGDSRHHTFTNMNIEDVKVAYKLQRARDNTFLDLNYTRVLSGGTIIELDSNSHNNKFENLYAVAQGSGQTFTLISDSNGSSNLPNFLTRVDGFQPSTVTINATLVANTILEQIDLSGGTPTVDTDITNRNNTRTFQDVLVTDEAYGVGWNGILEVATKNAIYDKIEALVTNLATQVSGVLGLSNGGTGTSTAPSTDQILVGNAGGTYDYRRITAGSNVTISTSTAGQIQISSTGGSATPAGSDTFLQYNNAGAFGATEQTNDAVRWMLDAGDYTFLVGTSSASNAKLEINNNDSTSDRGEVRVISTSASGADYDIRLDSPDADIEFCDQTTTPNGCFEINSVAANNQLYITPRNGSDTSFNPPVFTVNRNSSNGQGSIGINTQYDTPGAMLEIAGTNTLPYILALTSIKGGTDGDAFSVSSTSRIRASQTGATIHFGDYGSGNNIRVGEYNNTDSDILDMFGAAGTRIADASTLFFSTVNTGIATLLGTWDFSGATVNLPDNAVVEADLKAVDTASDEECLTYESSVGDFEWQTCGSGGSGGGLSTTTPWTNGNLAYVTGLGTVGSVATGTLTEGITGLEFSATQALVGGSAVLNLTSGYTVPTSTLINNLNSFYTTPSSVITAGTGIDWTGNTLNGVYTAGDALTLTGEDFDFDGGATPQGELGGTWASPTLDDSVAVTGWNLTTPTLTSFFGTPCTSGEFLTDISDTGAFTCAAGGGGGGGGALSTTTDIIGDGGSQAVSYVEGDVMFGGNSSTTAEFQLDDDGAKLIISSTTNSNATATLESSNNAQAVRIGDDSGVGMENIFSTVGDMITRFYGVIVEWIIDIPKTVFTGKVFVATTTYNGATTTDALVVNGFTNSGEWIVEFCTSPSGETTQIIADTLRGCGRFAYIEDAAGVLDFVAPTTGTSSYFRIRTGATGTTNAAGDGFGFGWGSGLDFGDIQKSQPAMEWAWRTDAMGNATSAIMIGGITDAITVSANYAVEPAQGFYVVGSSTQANWQFACNPSTGGTTYINTGIATTTVTSLSATTNNPFVHWRLEVGGTANTAVTAVLKARTTTNQNFTEVGSCTQNNSASTQIVAPTIGNGRVSAGTLSAEIHLMFLKFWYKQPVF